MKLGIDVSHYTQLRSWKDLTGIGVSFAFVKASEGSTIRDACFDEHWRAFHDAGIACGAYHYARPGTDAATQANQFYSIVGDLAPADLQPAIDVETSDGLAPQQVVDWILRFVDVAESLFGVRLMVYTGGFWRRTLGDPLCATLGERRLWTARYGTDLPVLPRPWQQWSIWQFSDGIHSCPPEASQLNIHCDWNRLADGLDVSHISVLANRITKKPVSGSTSSWPGRYFVFPATPAISGDDVRQWQSRMRERGWNLEVDGNYGPQSRATCLSFQRQEGLVPDGIVGPTTWQAAFAQS